MHHYQLPHKWTSVHNLHRALGSPRSCQTGGQPHLMASDVQPSTDHPNMQPHSHLSHFRPFALSRSCLAATRHCLATPNPRGRHPRASFLPCSPLTRSRRFVPCRSGVHLISHLLTKHHLLSTPFMHNCIPLIPAQAIIPQALHSKMRSRKISEHAYIAA